MATTTNTTSGLRALIDITWMARRAISRGERVDEGAFNDAQWLLAKMAQRARLTLGHPDQTANGVYDEKTGQLTETASYFADGAPVDFEPTPERAIELTNLSDAAAVQWIVEVMHPLAHAYADGRATYATGMCNDATRVLRAAGFDLSATEALGLSVWVTDGMGDSFLGLTSTEVAERNAARTGTTHNTGF